MELTNAKDAKNHPRVFLCVLGVSLFLTRKSV